MKGVRFMFKEFVVKLKPVLSIVLVLCVLTSMVLLGGSNLNQNVLAKGGKDTVPNGIVITSHSDGQNVAVGTVRISGTFKDAFGLTFIANAHNMGSCHTDDPNGLEAGTWYFDLDTTQFDGDIEIIVRAYDSDTRGSAWSSFMTLNVDNAAANVPTVTIVNPIDGSTVDGIVPITVSSNGRNAISSVEVRINNGEWHTASFNGTEYVYNWDTTSIINKTCCIEARVTDSQGNIGTSMTTYAKVGTGTNETLTIEDQDRAVWIWENSSYEFFLEPSTRAVLDSWAKDTTFTNKSVDTLYVATEVYNGMKILDDNPAALRDFNAWAHANGYKVYALVASGNIVPQFGAYTRYHDIAINNIEKLINFNIGSAENEKFDGVNVDVEPYLLCDFKDAKPDVQIQYLDMLDKMMQRRNTSGIDLIIGPAIPRWYDSSVDNASNIPWNGETKWLSEHVQDISDYISIMDYVDVGSRIIDDAQTEVNYANSIGKPESVIIGVETQAIERGGDPEGITFWEEGRTYCESELQTVYNAYETNTAFGGIALHHYEDMRELPSVWGTSGYSWQPPVDTISPSALSSGPVAETFDFQRIDISYGKAIDNTEVKEYYIYRSTTAGFTPDASNFAGSTYKLGFSDTGLLPNTTYYYKVRALDLRGNMGPVSAETSATTENSTLKPMVIGEASITYDGERATFVLTVVDMETREPLHAYVHGRFTYMAGDIEDCETDRNGIASRSSESFLAPDGGKVGFNPERIHGEGGYYWAKAYDTPQTIVTEW